MSSTSETHLFTIEVKGRSAAQRIANLLYALDRMSSWGCSRSLKFDWDGDGWDKLNVIEKSLEENVSKDELNKALNHQSLNVMTAGIKGCRLEWKTFSQSQPDREPTK